MKRIDRSHLAEVDCVVCGELVYAVPERADEAKCADCGRDAAGCSAPPPANRFPRVEVSDQWQRQEYRRYLARRGGRD